MTVSLSIGTIAGVSIPLLMRRLGFDPAVFRHLLIMITDAIGLLSFLGFAAARPEMVAGSGHRRPGRVLIDRRRIAGRVDAMASEIEREYSGGRDAVLFVPVLDGVAVCGRLDSPVVAAAAVGGVGRQQLSQRPRAVLGKWNLVVSGGCSRTPRVASGRHSRHRTNFGHRQEHFVNAERSKSVLQFCCAATSGPSGG